MKEFEIRGKLIVDHNITHEKMLHELYAALKSRGMLFIGETKEVKKN